MPAIGMYGLRPSSTLKTLPLSYANRDLLFEELFSSHNFQMFVFGSPKSPAKHALFIALTFVYYYFFIDFGCEFQSVGVLWARPCPSSTIRNKTQELCELIQIIACNYNNKYVN